MLSQRLSKLVIFVLLILLLPIVIGVGQETGTSSDIIQHPFDTALQSVGTATSFCGEEILNLVSRYSKIQLPATLGDPLGIIALITAAALLLLSRKLRYLIVLSLAAVWILFVLRVAEVL